MHAALLVVRFAFVYGEDRPLGVAEDRDPSCPYIQRTRQDFAPELTRL